jgi:nucleoid-associated protein YgaU
MALLACVIAAGASSGCKSGGKQSAGARIDALEQENQALRERLAELQAAEVPPGYDGRGPRTAPVLGDPSAGGQVLGGGDPDAVHVVQRGETLSSLARRYYGDAGKWRVIYEANRRTIGHDHNRLLVGMQLVIPAYGAG